jgi:hypothetical protein
MMAPFLSSFTFSSCIIVSVCFSFYSLSRKFQNHLSLIFWTKFEKKGLKTFILIHSKSWSLCIDPLIPNSRFAMQSRFAGAKLIFYVCYGNFRLFPLLNMELTEDSIMSDKRKWRIKCKILQHHGTKPKFIFDKVSKSKLVARAMYIRKLCYDNNVTVLCQV